MRPVLRFLANRWFLVSLVVLISGGLYLGATQGREFVDALAVVIRPRVVTGIVLFLMAFSLDTSQLAKSFRSPGPVVWAFAVNFAVIPLLAWALMTVQTSPDFAYGLMIAGSVPCTMAAASVWTRRAGGNDAVSLLVTASTNSLCILLTPFWLNLTTTGDVSLNFWVMFVRLVQAVLIPTLIGQLLRQTALMLKHEKPDGGAVHRLLMTVARGVQFAIGKKKALGVIAQACILTIVFSAGTSAGVRLSGSGPQPGLAGVVLVWATCIAIHLAAMGIAGVGARGLGFSRQDRVAILFAGSQKTLPIGVLLATDPTMFGNPNLLGEGIGIPFAVFPMLMYHASQLFIDTAIADRLAAAGSDEAAATATPVQTAHMEPVSE